MHWPRWFRLTTEDSVPKYQHIASFESAFDNASTRWKQRFYILCSVYIVTTLIFIAGFLFKSPSITEGYGTLRTDAVFGASESSVFKMVSWWLIQDIVPREQVLFTPNQTYRDIFKDSPVSESESLTLWDALQPRMLLLVKNAMSPPHIKTFLLAFDKHWWLAILDIGGGGFIIVSDPEKYGLSGGFPLEDEDDGIVREGYGISMFHQIHCLVSRELVHSWMTTNLIAATKR